MIQSLSSTFVPSSAQSLLSLARSTPVATVATPSMPADTFTASPRSSGMGDKIKGAVIIGGIGLVGAAIGAYAGLNTGILAGLAGTIAGACGGASLATTMKSTPIMGGAIVGAIAGTLIGATCANPVLGLVMGAAGASLPYAALVTVMSGAS